MSNLYREVRQETIILNKLDSGVISQEAENLQSLQTITPHKFITSSNLQVRIENLEYAVSKLKELMQKYSAYASLINTHDNLSKYTLKVPAEKYNSFLEELVAIGKIIMYSETTEDITMNYYDLESRLSTKQELVKTYQNYLAKAKNIDEILKVEKEIGQIQAEIDKVGKQIRIYDNLIQYSTIQLELLGPVPVDNQNKITLGHRINGLMSGLDNYFATILIIILGIVVYGIPAIIILFLLYFIFFGKIGLLKRIYRRTASTKNKN
ncbi:MAG: DUF4349 domain-containing protein [Spirochaetaceae bacterium]|nr:DUF4349 domain-containing protein [Spirochaetaceae bacterium]